MTNQELWDACSKIRIDHDAEDVAKILRDLTSIPIRSYNEFKEMILEPYVQSRLAAKKVKKV